MAATSDQRLGADVGAPSFRSSVPEEFEHHQRRDQVDRYRHCMPMADCQPSTSQSRTMSLVEAVANVVAGFAVAVLTQTIVFPLFGLSTSIEQNLQIGAIFTVVSIARSFSLRRVFEAIRVRHGERGTAARLRAADDRTSEID